MMFIFFIALLVLIYFFFDRGKSRFTAHHDDAVEILKIRYAKGEITKEQFEKMRKEIMDRGDWQ